MIDSASNRLRIGILLLGLASIGFSSLAVLTKLAYAEGGTVVSVLVLRYSFGALAFVPAALATVSRVGIRERARNWLVVAFLYVLGAGAFYWAITFEKVSEVAPIVYLFPGIVILIERFFYHEVLGTKGIVAITVGILGSIMVLGHGLGTPTTLAGGGLALVSAGATAGQYVVAAHKVERGDQLATAASMVCLSILIFGAMGAVVGFPLPSAHGWILMFLIAGVGAAMPLPYLVGLSRAGAGRAAMVSVCEPLFIVVLALVVLRETIAPIQAAGVALILASFLVGSTWLLKDETRISRVAGGASLRP